MTTEGSASSAAHQGIEWKYSRSGADMFGILILIRGMSARRCSWSGGMERVAGNVMEVRLGGGRGGGVIGKRDLGKLLSRELMLRWKDLWTKSDDNTLECLGSLR